MNTQTLFIRSLLRILNDMIHSNGKKENGMKLIELKGNGSFYLFVSFVDLFIV